MDSKRQKWELVEGQNYTFSATKDMKLDIRGRMYKGILPREKTDVAVRILAIDDSENKSQLIWATLAPICALRNRYILRLLGASISPDRVHLVTELMEIDLHNALHNPACKLRNLYLLTGPNGKKVLRGTANGLTFLHSKNITHSNIKSQNILLEGKNVKIGDIGSTQIKVGFGKKRIVSVSKPEDIRRLGVVIWEVATGKRPHTAPHEILDPEQITNPGLRVLYRECTDKNECARPNAANIMKRLNKI